MKLNLKRPIVFFDLETTGLDTAKDRIVEIAYLKVYPNGEEESHRYLINPERHIPEETTKVHGIADDDVKNAPTFKQKARDIEHDFAGSDIAGYNSNNFDIPMLMEEFMRVGVNPDFIERADKVDVQVIFHKKEPRNLTAAYKLYCGKDHIDAHTALGDVIATYEVLQGQLDRYPDLSNDIKELAALTTPVKRVDPSGRMIFNDKGKAVFNFGKFKGREVEEILKTNPGYFDWMMNSDFPEQTKQALTKIKLSMK